MIRSSLTLTAALLFLACPAPSPAAGALANLLACRNIPQAAARLACFDRRSARLAAATFPGHALAPRRTFGLPEGAIVARERAAGVRPKALSRLSSHIARIARAADGRLIFVLDNRQVWVQLERHHDVLARPGEAVTISRQLFGSYWMALHSGRGFKVERVRQ